MRKLILVSTALLLLILAGLIYFQSLSLKQLKLENEALRTEAENITAASNAIPEPQASPATNQMELLRLRGEVARLHGSLAKAMATIESLTNSPAETSDSPVENYLINVQTNLTWGDTLVVGGWKMANNVRGIIFIQVSNQQEIWLFSLRAQLFLVTDQMLTELELDELRTDSKRSSRQIVLSAAEADRTIGMLTNAGLKPQAVGRVEQRGFDSTTYERRAVWAGKQYSLFLNPEHVLIAHGLFSDPLRPVLIITPTVLPDRQSVQLMVSALLNYPLK